MVDAYGPNFVFQTVKGHPAQPNKAMRELFSGERSKDGVLRAHNACRENKQAATPNRSGCHQCAQVPRKMSPHNMVMRANGCV